MGAGDPSDSEENSSSEYTESPKSSDGGVGSCLRLLFLPMVEARVLLVRGVLRLIRALEPGALDGPDVSLDLRRKPLGVV